MKNLKTLVSVVVAGSLLVACSPQNENPAPDNQEVGPDVEASADGLEFTDAVVREKGADQEMTGIFGELVNNSEEDVTIEGFTTSLGDAHYEIHEVVDGTMQKMSEPLVIAAGETRTLQPGGDHFMIMGYPEEIPAGETIDLTIELAEGDDVEVKDIPVRTMGAGDESYGEDGHLMGH